MSVTLSNDACNWIKAKFPRERFPLSRTKIRLFLKNEVMQGKWIQWVRVEKGHATDVELNTARGPTFPLAWFNAADFQTVTFLTHSGQPKSKRCNDSYVLTWHTSEGVRYPYVGGVKAFLSFVPPWAVGTYEERQAQAVKLVDAEWFEYMGRNSNVMEAPVYSKQAVSEREGNLWSCNLLEPVPIGFADYVSNEFHPQQNLPQVLVRDANVFKPLAL